MRPRSKAIIFLPADSIKWAIQHRTDMTVVSQSQSSSQSQFISAYSTIQRYFIPQGKHSQKLVELKNISTSWQKQQSEILMPPWLLLPAPMFTSSSFKTKNNFLTSYLASRLLSSKDDPKCQHSSCQVL